MIDLHPSYCQCPECETNRARKRRREHWLTVGISVVVSLLVCVAYTLLTRPTF